MSQLLTDRQYDMIMQHYQMLRLEAQRTLEHNRKLCERTIPELKDIDTAIAEVSINSLRGIGGASVSTLSEEIKKLHDKKTELLRSHGFSEDFLEIKYSCDKCKDTGYIGQDKCDCFKRNTINLIYSDARWQNMFYQENFDNFDISLYDDSFIDSQSGISFKASALDALNKAHQFADNVIDKKISNLIISGNTGVGKTFLCNCIAKEVIEAGEYVVYLTSPALFEIFEKAAFSRKGSQREFSSESDDFSLTFVYDCDLLIIDDLGAEFPNTFTNAKIFDLLNRRLLNGLSTLISTNLSLQGLKDFYSERFISRIIGNYSLISLYGEYIRIKKRLFKDQSA